MKLHRRRWWRWLLGTALLVLGLALCWTFWPRAELGRPPTSIVDHHVHVAGLGYGSESFVSERLQENIRFPYFLAAMGVTPEDLEVHGDQWLFQQLASRIRASRHVEQAVVLALDGVVDDRGELDRARTVLYVDGPFVARQTARFDELLYGASINPYRRDALERLEQAAADGAVLIKWIPSVMHINPADPELIPFYDRLVALDIPLLTHVGQERAFPGVHDEYGDPLHIELPLSRGVTVIAAHIGTTGAYAGEPSFDRLRPLIPRWPSLYVDISSLTQINKLGYLDAALEDPVLIERMIYGSDWPLQFFPLVHPLYQWPDVSIAEARAIAEVESAWDADVLLKHELGVPNEVFTRRIMEIEPNRKEAP